MQYLILNKMTKSLLIEWYILSRLKSFWIIVALGTLSMLGFPFIVYTFRMSDVNSRLNMIDVAFSFPTVFNTISVLGLLPFQLIAIYYISIICNGFEFNTFRLHIQAGSTKFELWLSKLYLNIIICFCFIIVVFLTSLLFGIIIGEDFHFNINLNSVKWISVCFLQAFIYLNFAMTLSLIVKKSGVTIIIYIIWFGLFERTIAQIINFWLHLQPLGDLLIGQSIENLSRLEAFKNYYVPDHTNLFLSFFMAFLWLIISIITNIILFKKAKY